MALNDSAVPAPSRLRRLAALRWPALVVGLVLIGASATYLVAPPAGTGGSPILVDPQALRAGSGVRGAMPALIGLERDVARTVLSDSGLGAVPVGVAEKQAAGPVGLVLEQKPPAGAEPGDRIELTVSVSAQVPAVVGTTVDAAKTALEQLGAVVRVAREIDAGVPRGQVVAVDPPARATLPAVVTLKVADPGDALSLSAVSTVARTSCSTTDKVTVNGGLVGPSVRCEPTQRTAAYAEYALARNAIAFEALVGTDDRQGTGNAEVLVFGDGRELGKLAVGLGRAAPLRADVRGVLRLRIEVRTGDKDTAPDVVLGDAKLLGEAAGLDVIAAAK